MPSRHSQRSGTTIRHDVFATEGSTTTSAMSNGTPAGASSTGGLLAAVPQPVRPIARAARHPTISFFTITTPLGRGCRRRRPPCGGGVPRGADEEPVGDARTGVVLHLAAELVAGVDGLVRVVDVEAVVVEVAEEVRLRTGVGRPGPQQCATDECRTDGRSDYFLHGSELSFVVSGPPKLVWLRSVLGERPPLMGRRLAGITRAAVHRRKCS